MQKLALISLSTLVICLEVSFTQSATAASARSNGSSVGHSASNLIAKACTIRRYRRPR